VKLVVALACLAALGAAGCGGSDKRTGAPAGLADLEVTVDPDGSGTKQPHTTSVRCESAGDSQPCQAVAGMKAETFAPVPGDVACTELYGGPQTATVTGTLHGDAIHAKFSRVNGCEISRWDRAAGLLEAAG
jgi:hypothetical protein